MGERLLILADQQAQESYLRQSQNEPEDFANPDNLGRLARAVISVRRLRERHFDKELFADPAWEMLLDLFNQQCAGRRTSVTSLCVASRVPEATALRRIKDLTQLGLMIREDDQADRRRTFLRLTPRAETAMALYLEQARRRFARVCDDRGTPGGR